MAVNQSQEDFVIQYQELCKLELRQKHEQQQRVPAAQLQQTCSCRQAVEVELSSHATLLVQGREALFQKLDANLTKLRQLQACIIGGISDWVQSQKLRANKAHLEQQLRPIQTWAGKAACSGGKKVKEGRAGKGGNRFTLRESC